MLSSSLAVLNLLVYYQLVFYQLVYSSTVNSSTFIIFNFYWRTVIISKFVKKNIKKNLQE